MAGAQDDLRILGWPINRPKAIGDSKFGAGPLAKSSNVEASGAAREMDCRIDLPIWLPEEVRCGAVQVRKPCSQVVGAIVRGAGGAPYAEALDQGQTVGSPVLRDPHVGTRAGRCYTGYCPGNPGNVDDLRP